jgi:hypothetical protein
MPENDLSDLDSYPALEAFVRSNRSETRTLEYKPLDRLKGCGRCAYCKTPNPNEREARRMDLAREAVAMANGVGGWIVVGARRTDPTRNRGELESACCRRGASSYTPEMVEERIRAFSAPALVHRPATGLVSDSGIPAFILRIDASLRLHALVEGQLHRFPTRGAAGTRQMRVDEIENAVLYRQELDRNRTFRGTLHSRLYDFLRVVRGIHSEPTGRFRSVEDLLDDVALDFAHLAATSDASLSDVVTNFVFELRAHDVSFRIPRELAYARRFVLGAASEMHGSLSADEQALLNRLEHLPSEDDLMGRWSPVADVTERSASEDRQAVDRWLSRSDVSYKDAFDGLASEQHDRFLDQWARRVSIASMVDVLMDLVPLSVKILRTYESLVAAYGPEVLLPWNPLDEHSRSA